MLLGTVWHGCAVWACILLFYQFQKLRELFQGRGIKCNAATVGTGICVGLAGYLLVVSALLLLPDTPFLTYPLDTITMAAVTLAGAVLIVLAVYLAGFAAEKLLRKYSFCKGIGNVAVMVGLFYIAFPIAWGWGESIWGIVLWAGRVFY